MDSEVEQAPSSGKSSRRLLVQVAVPVVAGLILKVLEPLVPAQWGIWPARITTALALVAILYAMFVGWRWLAPRVRAGLRERQIDAEIRERLLALGAELLEATTQNFTRGVATILHDLTDAKVLDARSHNQYRWHISTLWRSGSWILSDVRAKRLSSWDGLQRMVSVQRDYVRLCCGLVDVVASVNRVHLQRHWDDIQEHANSISRRLCELVQVVQLKRGAPHREYIETVHRAYRNPLSHDEHRRDDVGV